MTNQDKKAYLNRYIKISNQVNQLLLEKDEILALGTKITPTYSDMPHGSSGSNKIPSVVERLAQQDTKINNKIDQLIEVKEDIERAIHTVTDDTLRLLLRYRYINGWTLERIAVEMQYCYRDITRKHGKALCAIKI